MSRRQGVVIALLVLATVGSAIFVTGVLERPSTTEAPAADRLVAPETGASQLWPYTSTRRSPAGRTLALNVVVHGSPATVRDAMQRRATVLGTADNAVGEPSWRPARGSTRYTYVTQSGRASGRWTASTYQLEAGSYLGQRVHVRAYPAFAGNWTALQVHTEYWDWYRLRHTVTGVDRGARFVASDLRDEPAVTRVDRRAGGTDGSGHAWTAVLRFAPAVLAAGVALPVGRHAWDRRDAALAASLAGVVVGVRALGLVAEGLVPGVTPKLFAAILYPFLAGMPVVLAFELSRDRPVVRSAVLAGTGLGVGIVADAAVLGLGPVATDLVVHRLVLVCAIGLVAAGGAAGRRRMLAMGVLAWGLALAAPLAGLV